MTPEKHCSLFIKHKKRFCRLPAAKGTEYCVHHLPKEDREKIDRIPCPFNDNHTVTPGGLKKHLLVCPHRPEATNRAPRVNSMVLSKSSVTSLPLPHIHDIVDEVLQFIEKLKRFEKVLGFSRDLSTGSVHDKFVPVISSALQNPRHWSVNGFPGLLLLEGTKSHEHEECIDIKESSDCDPISAASKTDLAIPESRGAKRHIYQNGCLLNVLKSGSLLSSRFTYVEFGAGRGGLSHWLDLCLATEQLENQDALQKEVAWISKPVDTNFILIELKSTRHKFDTRHRDAGNFIRMRMDIAELDLDTVPAIVAEKKPIVAVAKHLCGDATDLSLRCLKNALKNAKANADGGNIKIAGLMFAVCCHHQCTWEEAVGRYWLENVAGLTAREFAIAARLSSWATCGFKRVQRSHGRFSDQHEAKASGNQSQGAAPEPYKSPFARLNPEERASIGRACKRLIDWSRLCFIQHELGFPQAKLLPYTSLDVTVENVVLIAGNHDQITDCCQ